MKELYNEYFHIPRHGKIRDKVMLIRTTLTAVAMIICLAAMSFSAYAYFSHNITSGSNLIKAANFEAEVAIKIKDSSDGTVTVTQSDDKTYAVNLTEGTYIVELTKGTSTAETGFCIVTIGETKYYTQQIGVDKDRNLTDASVTFTLKVSENTNIEIHSHWGTSSYYGYKDENNTSLYIRDNDEIDLTTATNGVEESPSNEEQGTTGDTTATETTPTEVVYTVQSGDTLSKIASQYGTIVERIVAYNGLTDPDKISVDQKIKIPPADWVIPE